MALFVVNRYQELEEENNVDQEEANLQKLKQLIEKRRKEKIKHSQRSISNGVVSSSKQDEILQEQKINDSYEEKSFEIKETNLESKVEDTADNLADKKNNFKVLGTSDFVKKIKVKRVLPYWLSNPTAVSVDLRKVNCCVENIDFLDFSLKKNLMQEGIQYLFPVQAEVIPWILQENKKSHIFWPRDVCVSAPTGSGKTLAYVLPIIQVLTSRVDRQIRALIILPVKELAIQVAKVFKQYCVGTNLKVAMVTGSTTFAQEQLQLLRYTETRGWQSEVDIIVCTAGRLVEHLQCTEGFSLKHLKFLVMDEADRIMDHIQNDWLHHLNRHVESENSIMTGNMPPINAKSLFTLKCPPQKLFFSATLSQDPEKLNQWSLFEPKLFSAMSDDKNDNEHGKADNLGKYTTPLELTEKYIICDVENKPLILYNVLEKEACERVLVFLNSALSAHRLTVLLNHLLKGKKNVAEISASLNRNARDKVLKHLQSGKINVLISTDALARGIDISNCDLVVSYDPPKNIKTYIHRVGRTGRAGRSGTAVVILAQNQLRPFQDILKTAAKSNVLQTDVEQSEIDNLRKEYNNAVKASGYDIQDETHRQIDKLKSLKRGRSINTFSKKKKIQQE